MGPPEDQLIGTYQLSESVCVCVCFDSSCHLSVTMWAWAELCYHLSLDLQVTVAGDQRSQISFVHQEQLSSDFLFLAGRVFLFLSGAQSEKILQSQCVFERSEILALSSGHVTAWIQPTISFNVHSH